MASPARASSNEGTAEEEPARRHDPAQQAGERFVRREAGCADPLHLYLRDQLLWLRLASPPPVPELAALRDHAELLQKTWTVENRGALAGPALAPERVLQPPESAPAGAWYVSAVVQKDAPALEALLAQLPWPAPPMIPAQHDPSAWLFVGRNQPNKRPRRASGGSGLTGRAEHVDDVKSGGTWHLQLSGRKTWWIRPAAESGDWEGAAPSLVEGQPLVERRGRGLRLRIDCERGDLLLINTNAWWHCTELPASDELSVSVARDFKLGAPPMLAPRSANAGEVLVEEDELPEDFDTSDDPNCQLAELEGGRIVLIALRPVEAGERLTIGDWEAEDEQDEEEKHNTQDGIDPRLLCKCECEPGHVVLREAEIPEQLSYSATPNCELQQQDDGLVMIAVAKIGAGEVLSVPVEDGEEYEEWELDQATGQMIRV